MNFLVAFYFSLGKNGRKSSTAVTILLIIIIADAIE